MHSGTVTGKCSPSQEKDMATRETWSLPEMVHEVQALLWTGMKIVFLISLDIGPRKEQVTAHQTGTLPWASKYASVATTSPPQTAKQPRGGIFLWNQGWAAERADTWAFLMWISSMHTELRVVGQPGRCNDSGLTSSYLPEERFSSHPSCLFGH